jgi:hypothetical protein
MPCVYLPGPAPAVTVANTPIGSSLFLLVPLERHMFIFLPLTFSYIVEDRVKCYEIIERKVNCCHIKYFQMLDDGPQGPISSLCPLVGLFPN